MKTKNGETRFNVGRAEQNLPRYSSKRQSASYGGRHTCHVCALVAAGLSSAPAYPQADIEALTAALRACVESHLPVEMERENLTAQSLLQTCQPELDRLIQSLPSELGQSVRLTIEQQTEERLRAETGP